MNTETVVCGLLLAAAGIVIGSAVASWVVAERDERRWRRKFMENMRHGQGRERL